MSTEEKLKKVIETMNIILLTSGPSFEAATKSLINSTLEEIKDE